MMTQISFAQSAKLKEAMKGYENAKTYLDRTSRMFAVASKRLSDTPVLLMDKGIQYYNEREFEQSVEQFEYAHIAMPKDTVSLIYGVSAANQGQLYESAYSFYEELTKIRPKPAYYQNMYVLQKQNLGDNEKALQLIQQAQNDFPENYSFQKYEVDLLIKMNRKDEALELLNTLESFYPNNMAIVLNKSSLMDEAFKTNRAELDSVQLIMAEAELISAYEKVLDLSPRHPLVNFNLAAIYSEKSNDLIRELNGMNSASFAASSAKHQADAKLALEKATAYMEAAKQAQPKNINILNALKLFYDRLELKEKSAAIQKEIAALKDQ